MLVNKSLRRFEDVISLFELEHSQTSRDASIRAH
jgi:hypothetical protein